jgi:hypothetical protein
MPINASDSAPTIQRVRKCVSPPKTRLLATSVTGRFQSSSTLELDGTSQEHRSVSGNFHTIAVQLPK